MHLPLLLRMPSAEFAGLRLNALTQPRDLLATIFGAQADKDATQRGHSLWPLIRGETQQIRAHAMTALRKGEEGERALRTLEWAFLLPMQDATRGPQLFVKPDDRWEVNDVRQHHLELGRRWKRFSARSRFSHRPATMRQARNDKSELFFGGDRRQLCGLGMETAQVFGDRAQRLELSAIVGTILPLQCIEQLFESGRM